MKNDWSLVIQRASAASVDIWVGSLVAGTREPVQAFVEIFLADNQSFKQQILQWQMPYKELQQGIYSLCRFDQLASNTRYKVLFSVQANQSAAVELVGEGVFTTLPMAIPAKGEKPFTIGLGSCFSNQDDHGRVSQAYKALYESGDENVRPDVTFLVGDQVYLDIGFASLIPFSGFIRRRIANRYAVNWKSLAGVFTSGATWMLPDDHEYWNDYPFNDLPILALHSLRFPSVRRVWESAATDAANNIQSARMIEIIAIGDDLSICLANLRSQRAANQFISPVEFEKLIAWARSLTTPGVLVVQQLLMDIPGPGEKNITSFTQQYMALLEALESTGNDILVLSGDVHFGRVASVQFGTKGARLTEVVASPLSNLKGFLNGFAADVASNLPDYFPAINDEIPAVPKMKVVYSDQYKVSHQPGRRFSVYPKARTDDHFMTISFSKVAEGELEFVVQAWRVRNTDPISGMPSPGFSSVYRATLTSNRAASVPDGQ